MFMPRPALTALALLFAALLMAAPAAANSALVIGDIDEAATGEDRVLYSCGKASGKVAVSFKPEVNLADLVSWAMGFTCKNFVYSAALTGRSAKVTIIAPEKLTPREAWRVFLVALQSMKLNIVAKGKVLEIFEEPQAGDRPLPIYSGQAPSATDQVARMIFRPRHIAAADLAAALTLVKSTHGTVSALAQANIVVVTDRGNHIAKMITLSKEVDEPVVDERLYARKIHHIDAVALVAKLSEILAPGSPPTRGQTTNQRGKKGGRKQAAALPQAGISPAAAAASATPSRIVADEISNTIFVVATAAAYRRVTALVDRLDLLVDGAGDQIHLYELANANAETLAQTLAALTAGSIGKSSKAKADPSGTAMTGQVRIAHDAETNSLLVVATTRDFLALSKIIRRLDDNRRQVYIEAMILEVRSESGREVGASFHAGSQGSDGSTIIGGLQHTSLSSANVTDTLSSTGLVGAIFGSAFTDSSLGITIPSFGVALQAMATSGTVDVVSSPHILTANHVEAEISVGKNIPYQSQLSAVSSASGDASLLSAPSVERKDINRTLKITPHVNNSELVRLDIELDIADVDLTDAGTGLGPTWTTGKVKNTIWVADQDSIVIGGLVSDRVEKSTSKIPLLGDLPVLGHLFKWSEDKKVKTNLLIVLTPHILHDRVDVKRILDRRMRERDEFLGSQEVLTTLPYRAGIDYGRKRGLVEEINRTVMRVEAERKLLDELDRRDQHAPDGLVLADSE